MKILMLGNSAGGTYNFRKELLQELIKRNHEVFLSVPNDDYVERIEALGCKVIITEFNRRGMNPKQEQILYKKYCKIIKEVKPDKILTYTIKPNIYGGIAAKKFGIPQIANITGLGTALENPGRKQLFLIWLYRRAFNDSQIVFFQNRENQEFFIRHNISLNRCEILPGSGVNINQFAVTEYPSDDTVRFLFISRIMKEKGIDYFLECAETIKKKYPNTEFHICGYCENEYEGKLDAFVQKGLVKYHGSIDNVCGFLSSIHCVVHPTYYPEGMSNVLLESCACGRPIITTDRSGCREVVEDGVNGYMVRCQNQEDLNEAIEKFLQLSYEQKKTMGLKARAKVEKEFDRQIVVDKYMKEIEKEV